LCFIILGEAISAAIDGKEWDDASGRWILYNLEEEAKLVLEMDEVYTLLYTLMLQYTYTPSILCLYTFRVYTVYLYCTNALCCYILPSLQLLLSSVLV
jgi:hypothetical protein